MVMVYFFLQEATMTVVRRRYYLPGIKVHFRRHFLPARRRLHRSSARPVQVSRRAGTLCDVAGENMGGAIEQSPARLVAPVMSGAFEIIGVIRGEARQDESANIASREISREFF